MTIPIKERFDEKWMPEPYSGCWLWIATTKIGTYGAFSVKDFPEFAHRVSWRIYRGDIPDGMFVCHRCDTPACVNPDHLFLGTHQDNVNDCKAKGRQTLGLDRKNTKLAPAQVLAIREDRRAQTAIAKDYGICQMQVSRIKRRTRWTYL